MATAKIYNFGAGPCILPQAVLARAAETYSHEISKVDPSATLFTLSPLSLSEIMQVADAGQTLPPKSTWMEPKVPFGLLIHQN